MKPAYLFSLVIFLAALIQPVSAANASFVVPTISIVSVAPNQSVTITTANFPPNDTYDVYMGAFGTQGVNGIKVGTVSSNGGGTLSFTFPIPAQLTGMARIAIRLQSPYSGLYSFNWLYNDPNGPQPPYPPISYIPTFSITSVVKDQSVTILTNNFPPNDTFDVLMGPFGTQGINGIRVGTINSAAGGSFSTTFNIPPALYGSYQIAIRLQSPMSGFYAYNWFYNNPNASPIPGPTPIIYPPSFTITSVIRDQSVAISTVNFPPNDMFDVYLGVYGSLAINGVKVTTVNSGSGGAFTTTFTIPPSLQGLDRIAIRMHSPVSGYYSYNWFWNNTYP